MEQAPTIGVARLRVGVLMERRPARSAWQTWSWYPAAVLPGTPDAGGWRLLRDDGDTACFLAGSWPITLYAGETAAYRQNLSLERPVVYVVLRPAEDDAEDGRLVPFHLTISPDEAQAYTEGDDVVHPVAMQGFVAAWAARFVAAHHRDIPFTRRARKGGSAGAHGAGAGAGARPAARPAWKAPADHG